MLGSSLRYYFRRKNEYHLHSPFMYELYTKVFKERQRVNVDYDLVMRVGKMVDGRKRLSRSRRKLARFFYRYAVYYEPEEVTLFGAVTAMDTAAFALGNPHAQVKVACPSGFVEALNGLGMMNVERVATDDVLRYILEHQREDVAFVVEGIHKDRDTKMLWETICEHPEVVLAIDFNHAGMVLFREGMEKQEFTL